MLKHSEFIAEQQKGLNLRGLASRLFLMRAFAEETDPLKDKGDNDPAKDNKDPINYESLISSARKEEKAKLYPRIEKLENENKELVKSSNGYLIKMAELQKEIDELKSNKGDSEELTKLKSQLATLEAENKTLKESAPNEEAIRARIEQEYEVKLYLTEQINANKEDILPTFAKNISGKTKEDIDKAIETAKTETLEIKKSLGIDVEKKKEDKPTTTKKKQGKVPVGNPADDGDEDDFDADYVRNLDPGSKEYAEWRKKVGLK